MPDNQYFSGNPVRLDISRSRMSSNPRWTGTWKCGYLVPIFCTSLVLPGSTYAMSIDSAIRLATPAFPTMDDIDITIEAYFVPHRVVMSRQSMSPSTADSIHSWQAFIGAQDSLLNMPTPTGGMKLPDVQIWKAGERYKVGGVADCLGMPPNNGEQNYYKVNPLKFMAYFSVWSEYFRDPNTMSPVTYGITSGTTGCHFFGSDAGIDGDSGSWAAVSRFDLAPVSRYHGYFGSALPWPQRNSTQVTLPLGDSAPILAGDDLVKLGGALKFGDSNGTTFSSSYSLGVYSTTGTHDGDVNTGSADSGIASGFPVGSTNLYADLSEATSATINQFRLAVQTQRYYEALARSGNKYHDLLHGIWGVQNANIQDRPEYLGGFTAPINMSQVAQTTGGSGEIGKVGAYSLSNPSGFLFKKSFTEHGTLIVVACCRLKDSFAQGISREDTKFDPLEYYVPQFANLGEQTILARELFVTGVKADDETVFGYQEAWAEYRYDADRVTGYARPDVSGGLGYLTYVNDFSEAPTLKGYLDASGQVDLLDRTLSVGSSTSGLQFFGQFQFHITKVLPMPLYSIPGLVDHH